MTFRFIVALFAAVLPALAAIVLTPEPVVADGPADNIADKVRRIPPPGVAVPEADKKDLEAGLTELMKEIDGLRADAKTKPVVADLLPDVLIYFNAVRFALVYNEFFNPKEIPAAKTLLKQGIDRARMLKEGKTPWTTQTGLVVRGYVSRLDGSVQPYGLVVPATYNPAFPNRYRLDLWWHGRGETLSEVNFLDQRQRSAGEFTPANAFVLHPYGRYCNANKFAGEIDTFEAVEHARRHYPIDENRIVARGFSMGGAACWQFTVHYPHLWAAAAPGAGFSETPDFLKVFQNETLKPTWYEQKLWRMHDCTDYALNLFNVPTVAYSGEVDKQKQAADVMVKAAAAEGIDVVHIIGPKTGHSYEKAAKGEINKRIDAIVSAGRNPAPRQVKFTTFTLRYNRCFWVTVEGLDKHWERGRIEADIVDANTVRIAASGISAFTLEFRPGLCPLDATKRPKVQIGGKDVVGAPVKSDRSWRSHFRRTDAGWEAVEKLEEDGLRKRPGLQGPIDDAFMDAFVFVKPTGQPLNEKVGKWAAFEAAHAIEQWRRHYRGEPRVRNDDAVSDADIANANLVLFGDPSSNKVLAKIADKLPIKWDAAGVKVGDKTFAGENHAAVFIFPNPLNARKYVVINSGFTFREYDYLNNARQVSKLPDWAVIDVNTPVSSRAPGGVAEAGFFGEKWELIPPGR